MDPTQSGAQFLSCLTAELQGMTLNSCSDSKEVRPIWPDLSVDQPQMVLYLGYPTKAHLTILLPFDENSPYGSLWGLV